MVADLAALLTAIGGLIWPILVAILLWRLYPAVRELVASRAFGVKFGEFELTVQEAVEKSVEATAQLQERLAITTANEAARDSDSPEGQPSKTLRLLLWVDDNPANNAYESAQLRASGIDVLQARSTPEALRLLAQTGNPVDGVISDMGRVHEGAYDPDAGLHLLNEIRSRRLDLPFVIYADRRTKQRESELVAAGAAGVADSPLELFSILRTIGRFPSEPA